MFPRQKNLGQNAHFWVGCWKSSAQKIKESSQNNNSSLSISSFHFQPFQFTLRELIFVGTNFHFFFAVFRQNHENSNLRKYFRAQNREN